MHHMTLTFEWPFINASSWYHMWYLVCTFSWSLKTVWPSVTVHFRPGDHDLWPFDLWHLSLMVLCIYISVEFKASSSSLYSFNMKCVIPQTNNLAALRANYVKVVEDRPILITTKTRSKNLVLAIYNLRWYSQSFLRTNSLEGGTPCQKQEFDQ